MSKLSRISVPSVEMKNYWFQSSRYQSSTDRWKHTQHKLTPTIHYVFRDAGYDGGGVDVSNNFVGNEPELLNKTVEIEKFATDWWNEIVDGGGGYTNAGKYANELNLEINAAKMRLYKKYQQKFTDDFHKEFNPLLKFINSKQDTQLAEIE